MRGHPLSSEARLVLVNPPGPVTVNLFTHANSPACLEGSDDGRYIYVLKKGAAKLLPPWDAIE